jgi:hypothetical protein
MSEDVPQAAPPAIPVPGGLSPRSGRGVTVAWCADSVEAELLCNELTAAGVAAAAVNQHAAAALSGYGLVRVEVQVAVEDRERAAEVLARLPGRHDVDPAEEPADGSADFATDAAGEKVPLAIAAEYGTAQEMLEASAALGSAHVQTYLPDLVPRRRDPAAEDADDDARPRPRFRLRVAAEDLERARRVLEESAQDDGDRVEREDPRCPKCASWRVYGSTPGVFSSILRLLTGGGGPTGKTWQCLRCGHRWPDGA